MSALEWHANLTADPSHRGLHLPDSEDKKPQSLIILSNIVVLFWPHSKIPFL